MLMFILAPLTEWRDAPSLLIEVQPLSCQPWTARRPLNHHTIHWRFVDGSTT